MMNLSTLSQNELSELRRRKAKRAMKRVAPLFQFGSIASVVLLVALPLAGVVSMATFVGLYFGLRWVSANRENALAEAEILVEFQVESNQRQDVFLLRTAHRFRAIGREDHADILLNILRLKRRLEARLDHSAVGPEADIDRLVSMVAEGVVDHLRALAMVEDSLASVLLSGDERRFKALEGRRANHLRQVRDAYLALMECSEILHVPHQAPVLPPALPAVRCAVKPVGSMDKVIGRLRDENAVLRRVQRFLDHGFTLDEQAFLVDQECAELQEL